MNTTAYQLQSLHIQLMTLHDTLLSVYHMLLMQPRSRVCNGYQQLTGLLLFRHDEQLFTNALSGVLRTGFA